MKHSLTYTYTYFEFAHNIVYVRARRAKLYSIESADASRCVFSPLSVGDSLTVSYENHSTLSEKDREQSLQLYLMIQMMISNQAFQKIPLIIFIPQWQNVFLKINKTK